MTLNANGTISLDNPNNNWLGLVDLTTAPSVTGVTLANIGDITFNGTAITTGDVDPTSGGTITMPNAAYSFTLFTASARQTNVSNTITTTSVSVTFTGTANLQAGTAITSAGNITFNGDVNVNTAAPWSSPTPLAGGDFQ